MECSGPGPPGMFVAAVYPPHSSSSFTVTPWRLGQVSKLEAQEFNNVLLSGPGLVIVLWDPAVTPRTLH